MAAIRAGDLSRFLATGWKSYRIFLVHGTDEGLVREISERLIALSAGEGADPMNHVVLEGEQIAQDPARLADEARTFAMFGGVRIIHLRNAGRVPAAVFDTTFADTLVSAAIILEAGELKNGAPLRALAEKSPNVAAIPCYADSIQHIQRLIAEGLSGHGLAITPDARDLLTHALGSDRALSRGEIEKLALYATGETTVDRAMVAAIVSDAARLDISALVDRVFAGQIREIETEANRFFAAGINPAAILSQTIGHILLLRRALRSGNAEMTAKQGRLHFSREAAFRRAAATWTENRLERALQLISEASLQGRRSARLSETLTIRALWAVCRLSGVAA